MRSDKYATCDGLSQDEFVRFQKMWMEFQDARSAGEVVEDLAFMITCLERMIDAKDKQIADVNEELFQIATAKKEHHDTENKEKHTS